MNLGYHESLWLKVQAMAAERKRRAAQRALILAVMKPKEGMQCAQNLKK